ncbi:hypothetical protein CLCR_08918 [Cladophialophora carrionii]|uniref:Metallo-beta-lactamase domain-containing protein n=1 Tax=Cladophialophora carrionii TaxID=86049 RepID=A0A1C1CTH7_9EURO|nr:hypothetical protein CLCR_08918 [Cladophialophora carrionii]
MDMALSLPQMANEEAKVSLRRLSGGYLRLPMHLFVEGSKDDEVRTVPCMSWLIEHGASNQKIIFDLGMRKDIQNYPPAVYHRLQTAVGCEVPEDVFHTLERLQVDIQSEIDAVVFSHLHYDHVGDPRRFGPRTSYIIGPGAKELIQGPGSYPSDEHSHYDSAMFPLDRLTELPPASSRDYWAPLGPFPETHDYFGDGSLYIINAPGHSPGHINLLVRLDPEHWAYLGGDTTHDPRILDNTARTAVYVDTATGCMKCAHHDKEAAERHLERVREIGTDPRVELILAHDYRWMADNWQRFGGSK